MKMRLITLVYVIFFSSSVYAGVQCPDSDLIQENINTFSRFEKDTITFDGQTWNFESGLNTPDVEFIKRLNTEISDIDEDTCNYLISLTDSNEEDATLLLHQRSNKARSFDQ